MRISLIFLFITVYYSSLISQKNVGIGTTTPDPTAALDIESTDKGILIPRVTTSQRMMIGGGSPATGLLVYDTEKKSIYFYDGTDWESLSSSPITDKDGDTRIYVEQAPDEDIIRFDIANDEKAYIDNNGLRAISFTTLTPPIAGYSYSDFNPVGGQFLADGQNSIGINGEANGAGGIGLEGVSTGQNGIGVQAKSENVGLGVTYGGKFSVKSTNGYGVFAESLNATSDENFGGYFLAAGGEGKGVYGEASSTQAENFGGKFLAKGLLGRGVYGEADNTSASTNYGGYFVARGSSGRGVYGFSSGSNGRGGYFVATGSSGRGVFAEANSGTGIYGKSSGSSGRGVYGESLGETGRGVSGWTNGSAGYGVYGQADATDAYAVYGTSTNGYAGYFNGNLCYTGSFGACSDLRFKNNISSISNALSGILKLRGISHTWKIYDFPEFNWPNNRSYGVIAQEVEVIFPHLVDEKDGYKYVDYAKFVPILIEAIKEQQNQIEELKSIVAKYK